MCFLDAGPINVEITNQGDNGWKVGGNLCTKTSDVAKVCFQCSFCSELLVLSKFHSVKNHLSFQNIQNESFSKIHIFQYVDC